MTNFKSIWPALDAWGSGLANWQRCLLSKAISKGLLSAQDIVEVFELFCRTNGLSDSRVDELLPPPASPRTEKDHKHLCLAKIDGLAGINAIPDGSELTFDSGLTVVYGRNGAGKSGFARLLANACFSRYKPDILSNIYAERECAEPGAVFHIRLDGELQPPVQYSLQTQHDELRRMCFFDVTIAKLHISQASNFEFKPSGFDVFPEMARVYGELSKLLTTEIQARASSVIDTAKIGSAGRVEVHHARLLAVIGVRKTFPHGLGQKAKYSLRADVFRFATDSGHLATAAAFPFRADFVVEVI
jgi:hypothetical protein